MFNILDLALIGAMGLTLASRLLTPLQPELTLPAQAVAAMLAWLRLLQVGAAASTPPHLCTSPHVTRVISPPRPFLHCPFDQVLYIFPSTGPLLIMTIRMLSDLLH